MNLNKLNGVRLMGLTAVILLGVLFFLSAFTKEERWEHLILVSPETVNSRRIPAEQLEEINGKPYLLTYEIESKISARALNTNHTMTIKETNAAYPFVMDWNMISGSFFTEKDLKEKKRLAVINRDAAVVLFGSTNACGNEILVRGERFTVIGVMEDSGGNVRTVKASGENGKADEDLRSRRISANELRLYVPTSCWGENPASFLLRTDRKEDETQARLRYKSLIETQAGYQSFSFASMSLFIENLFRAALQIGCAIILGFLLKPILISLKRDQSNFKRLHSKQYLRRLVRVNWRFLFSASMRLALALSVVLLILSQFLGVILMAAKWRSFDAFPVIIDTSAAGRYAVQLQNTAATMIFLVTLLIVNSLILFLQYTKSSKI